MLERIKLALRISHTKLDAEIGRTEEEARAELIRMGISESVASGDTKLVQGCILTYCLWKFKDDEKYLESFQYQADNLRKSEEVS